MSFQPDTAPQPETRGSQLSVYRRIVLAARKPKDAYQLFSAKERLNTGILIIVLYVIIRLPIQIQKFVVQDRLPDVDIFTLVALMLLAMVLAMIFSSVLMTLVGLFFHVVLNVILKAGRTLQDAITMPVLSLAPQLLIAVELPFLFLEFGKYQTYWSFLILRVLLYILSLRSYYLGCRYLFGLNKAKAIAVSVIPAIPITLMILMLIAILLR